MSDTSPNPNGQAMTPRGPLLDDSEGAGLSVAVGRAFMALKDTEAQVRDLSGQLMTAHMNLNTKTEENQRLQQELDNANAKVAELEQYAPKAAEPPTSG